jgi:hypothetical protein
VANASSSGNWILILTDLCRNVPVTIPDQKAYGVNHLLLGIFTVSSGDAMVYSAHN